MWSVLARESELHFLPEATQLPTDASRMFFIERCLERGIRGPASLRERSMDLGHGEGHRATEWGAGGVVGLPDKTDTQLS